MRYLGIDYGEKHVGLALGDDETGLAMPLETFLNEGTDFFCTEIERITQQEGIEALVVGVPTLGSTFQNQRKEIEDIIISLKERITIPIHTFDESFTSREAQHLMRDKGSAPGTDEHAIAAMLILQSFLDTKRI